MSSKTFQEEKHGAISQFLDLTVGELRHYLSVRGLTTTGTKLDLAVRALIAHEQGVSPKDTLEEKTKGLQSCYDQLLKSRMFLCGPWYILVPYFNLSLIKNPLKLTMLASIRQKRPTLISCLVLCRPSW